MHNQAIMYLSMARSVAYPKNDMLFVEVPVYEHLIDFELSINLYSVGRFDEALRLSEQLLQNQKAPHGVKNAAKGNRTQCLDALDRKETKDQKKPALFLSLRTICESTDPFRTRTLPWQRGTMRYNQLQHNIQMALV